MNQPLLEISGLRVEVGPRDRRVLATRDVDLVVERGMRLGVVGESGSGKSTTALAIMGVLPQGAVVERGSIRFQDRELVGMPEREYARLRGRELAMVFQSANAALNPVITVGDQIADVVSRHEGVSREVGRLRAVEALGSMGLPDPARNARAYPHQLSGGMAQRALIAMALVCRPTILIADEPTTGLDPIIQAQVLRTIVEQTERLGTSLVLVSHDLGVVARVCTHLAVMYAGSVVEAGPAEVLLGAPSHPYTRALMATQAPTEGGRAPFIPGRVPVLPKDFVGCAFNDRCERAIERGAPPECRQVTPDQTTRGAGHSVACHFPVGS